MLALAAVAAATADEGWVIERFHVDIAIQKSGQFKVIETIAVDFGDLEKHGIFRDIPYRYALTDDPTKVRTTSVVVNAVT